MESYKIMRQRSRWKLLRLLAVLMQVQFGSAIEDTRIRNVQKSLFSPRMDYNQWKPLGRGDPLKNDPTFDYVPPVLDHVHYWMDPEPNPQISADRSGENDQKKEILLLGVSSKKPASTSSNHGQNQPTASDRRDTFSEPYYKYPQDKNINFYNHNPNQRVAKPNYFSSMTSQIIPSLMSFANQVLDRTMFSKGTESKMPYTVLMPPPMITKDPSVIRFPESGLTTPLSQKTVSFGSFIPSQDVTLKNQHLTTIIPSQPPNSVTVQESNLVYQSSSLGNHQEFESVPSINWELPSTTEPIRNNFAYNPNLSPPKSFLRIQFSPQNYTNKILEGADSHHNINYVTPPPLDDSKMTFKGQVSDDNDISNSYVRIEKPKAQMDHMSVAINTVHPLSIIYPNAEPFMKTKEHHMNMKNIMDMETLQPPPVTQSPVYNRPTNAVLNALKKEYVNQDREHTNFIGSDSSISNVFVTTPKTVLSSSIATTATTPLEINAIVSDSLETNTKTPLTTDIITTEQVTTMQTLTTDPLFKHYKQPMEPMKGPLYLIIQGHSKVKTYKPAKQIDGIMIQETNEIPYLNDKNIDYSIKHLHGYEKKEDFLQKAETIAKQRQARTGNLQTLKHVVQTGLGSIDFKKEDLEVKRRSDIDLEETELEAGYEVVDSKDVTNERYYKGIVQEARNLI